MSTLFLMTITSVLPTKSYLRKVVYPFRFSGISILGWWIFLEISCFTLEVHFGGKDQKNFLSLSIYSNFSQ
jgi:hypothetical protein